MKKENKISIEIVIAQGRTKCQRANEAGRSQIKDMEKHRTE